MKIYVGMSGGVDSSLAAALLVEQGHDVTGVYMKNWSRDLPGMRCPWAEDLADAKRVAVQLGIDFKVFDFEAEYQQTVVDYMIDEYRHGRTPNPDIMCNQEVKFKLFLSAALKDGAEKIATGHYAQTVNGRLMMAADTNKDQTYFLYRVSRQALQATCFPLGQYIKPQVREMAAARGLYTAGKRDSQGICFVGKIGIRDFLSEYVQVSPGDIVERESGDVLGRHDGAIFYTLGQRHGLDVGGGLPYYVVGKDMEANIVYVSRDLNNASIWQRDIVLADVHWIDQAPSTKSCRIRVRHRAPFVTARLEYDAARVIVSLDHPQRAVTPGQSVVIYNENYCLGGGIVVSS